MRFWFGRKAAAPDERPFVPAWLQASEPAGFARSYDSQFEEVFRRNPVGQRSVRLVAGMLGALPVHAAEGDERAAAIVSADGLLEGIAANLLLHGNAYAQLLIGDDGAPAELCTLRPERVSVVSDERGWPTAYLYRVAGRVTRYERCDALGRRQMAHLKALHPRDDHYGMGCLEAACAAATVHNGAAKWNKALLDNAARPSGALVYDPGDGSTLSTDQFTRLKDELATEFSGSGNAGRPLLLEGGLKWQALSLSPADMDFVALKEGAARDIALAFGVPPVLVGLPGDATYANAREAAGALSAAALTETDLSLGRWDGARITLSAIDWEDSTAQPVRLMRGELGEVAVNGESFSADLHGASVRLKEAICPSTSPECRAQFGDKKCRVDLAGRSLRARLVLAEGTRLQVDQAVDGRFLFGRLRYMSGANCGATTVILAVEADAIRVRDFPKAAIAVGCELELREGCDKRLETCASRFGNAVNFRGEPHLPGNDLLTRYPGA